MIKPVPSRYILKGYTQPLRLRHYGWVTSFPGRVVSSDAASSSKRPYGRKGWATTVSWGSARVVIANVVKQSPGNAREIATSLRLWEAASLCSTSWARGDKEQAGGSWRPGRVEFSGQVFAETTDLLEDLGGRYFGEREEEFGIFHCREGRESVLAINDHHGVGGEELIEYARACPTIEGLLAEGFQVELEEIVGEADKHDLVHHQRERAGGKFCQITKTLQLTVTLFNIHPDEVVVTASGRGLNSLQGFGVQEHPDLRMTIGVDLPVDHDIHGDGTLGKTSKSLDAGHLRPEHYFFRR